jgi:serine/threonine-protein kinase
MTPQRWERIKELFHDALAREDGERDAFLEAACGADRGLRDEVASLLASDSRPATLLDGSLADVLPAVLAPGFADGQSDEPAGRRFGPYRAAREIGRGGMGVVYAAVRDDDQYDKQVAVKLIKRGMDTDAIVTGFRRERQILANLEHPSIARLLDGGVTDDGLPYLVMELVDGVPIDIYCERHGLGTAERLRLFRTVCAAVDSAHRSLVVHRDLKPSNILVSADGEVKLLDFGIAKLLDAEAAGEPTVGALKPMTPDYASPEQVRGGPITTASDVYALGVLLYLLLTGRRPLSFAAYTAPEIARVVCDQEPPRPSAVVAGRHGRALAGDLDTVVLKALAKSPERRYGSADQLSEDLRRHLEGLPVLARKDTFVYRAGKFVRRHRWGMAAAALVFLSLVAGMAAAAWQAGVARAERATAEWVSGFLVDLFEITHPGAAQGETVTAVQLLDQGARRIAGEPPERPEVQAALMDNIGRAYFKLGLYERAEPLLADALERRRAALGPDHPEVAASLHHVGELRAAQGRYEEAERMHRRELELRLAELGEGRQLVAESRNSLALALYPQSRFDEAEELLRRSLALQERALGGEHPEVATTLNNLALVLRSASRFEEAEALYRQALPILRGRLGEGAPELAACLNNLAQVLRVRGECEEAIGLWEDALTIERRILDERHPELAVLQNNLAGCLRDVGRDGEAERLYRASLELRRETLGPAHPDVADSLNNLARIHFDRGDLDAAESLYREALAVNRGRDGGKHLDVATNLSNLASVLARKADPAAEPLYREALALRLDLLGPEHAAVATDRHNLAGLLFRSGAFDEAEELYREALRVRRRTLGDGHRLTADTLFGLGWLLADRGPPERAEAPLREGLDLWRQWPEKEWVKVASTQSLLGGCLTALGRYAEAEPLLLESLAAFRGRLGDGDSRTVRTLRRAVELYEVWERPDEAARYRALL